MNNQYHIEDETIFFAAIKPLFVRRFVEFLQVLQPVELVQKDVDSLAVNLYAVLFSEDVEKERLSTDLRAIFDALAQQGMDFDQILSRILLVLVESYTEFLWSKVSAGMELTTLVKALKDYPALIEQKLLSFAYADEKLRQEQDKSEHREIISLLKQSHEKGATVELTNTFRGITVSYEARVIALKDHNQVTFEVHKYQTAAMALEKSTLLIATFLPKPVRARVASVNAQRVSADLCDFAYLHRTAVKRERLRLQPEKPIQVIFSDNDHEFFGTLVDISVNGMGVLVGNPQVPPTGTPVRLRLTLSGSARFGDREISLSGKVINRLRDPRGWRIGFTTYPDFAVEEIISRYLALMQTKILHDLQWRSLIG